MAVLVAFRRRKAQAGDKVYGSARDPAKELSRSVPWPGGGLRPEGGRRPGRPRGPSGGSGQRPGWLARSGAGHQVRPEGLGQGLRGLPGQEAEEVGAGVRGQLGGDLEEGRVFVCAEVHLRQRRIETRGSGTDGTPGTRPLPRRRPRRRSPASAWSASRYTPCSHRPAARTGGRGNDARRGPEAAPTKVEDHCLPPVNRFDHRQR